MSTTLVIAMWIAASCISAELLGYGLHRLLHSGIIPALSRSHMKHHLVLYGPLQKQRSATYQDATDESISIGNIGVEWLAPSGLLIITVLAGFWFFHVRWIYQLFYFVTTLGWSFLMFSWLHDVMHVEGHWLVKNRLLRRWFLSARKLHDIHHYAFNDIGLMNRNFGIGLFFFDVIFGSLAHEVSAFNESGYRAAQKRFKSVTGDRC